jgi:2'-5' RNA ligase
MARERVLVALAVPPPADTEVDGLRRALGDGALGRIGPHVTLVPPVNVADGRFDEALAVVRAAAAAGRPLRLQLGPATTFHPVTPVVYLAVGGPDLDGLGALRDRCRRPPLDRPVSHDFVPHVTVANRLAPERIPAAVAALADYSLPVTIEAVQVLRMAPGNLWQPVADAALVPPAVVGRGGLPLEVGRTDLVPPDAAALLGPGEAAPGGAGGRPWAVTARRDGATVGVAHGWTAGPACHLVGVVVAAGARRQGVGRHLLAAVEQVAMARGCDRLEADTPTDPAVEALFTAAGWGSERLGPAADGWRRRSRHP